MPAIKNFMHWLLKKLFLSIKKPVITIVCPIILGSSIGIGNSADPLDLLVTIFRRHRQTQWRAMLRREWLPAHIGIEHLFFRLTERRLLAVRHWRTTPEYWTTNR